MILLEIMFLITKILTLLNWNVIIINLFEKTITLAIL
jgi:hypothetical protein